MGVEAGVLGDADFSGREPGAVRDRANPELTPGWARTVDAYGRRLGNALNLNARFAYPEYDMGRDGGRTALASGSALASVKGSAPDAITLPSSFRIPEGKASTQLMWFWVYEPEELEAHVRLLDGDFGYKIGFRVEYIRATWAREGEVELIFGDGKTSQGVRTLGKMAVEPGKWHQLAVVNDLEKFTLWVDGKKVGEQKGKYLKGKDPIAVKLGTASNNGRFKTDCYRLYDEAWGEREVAADWEAGLRLIEAGKGRKREEAPKLEPARSGVYEQGEEVRVTVGGKTVGRIDTGKCGVRDAEWGGYKFPVAVVKALPRGKAELGATGLLTHQSELMALGIRKTLVRADWKKIEPERGAYDWLELDLEMEECERRGVEAVVVCGGVPGWCAGDEGKRKMAREKFTGLVAARYQTRVAEEGEVAFVDISHPPHLAMNMEKARKSGAKHLFVKGRHSEWMGKYSAAFGGRPNGPVAALADWLAGEEKAKAKAKSKAK